jgi:hypothetical protein
MSALDRIMTDLMDTPRDLRHSEKCRVVSLFVTFGNEHKENQLILRRKFAAMHKCLTSFLTPAVQQLSPGSQKTGSFKACCALEKSLENLQPDCRV